MKNIPQNSNKTAALVSTSGINQDLIINMLNRIQMWAQLYSYASEVCVGAFQKPEILLPSKYKAKG